MAKKKQTHHHHQQELHPNADTTPVENTTETISNLKSLNAMLVNEMAKKRQEITALLDDKKSLEAELTQSNSAAVSLRSELTRAVEERVEMEKRKCEGDVEIGKLKEFGEELRRDIERGRAHLGAVMVQKEKLENGFKLKDGEVKELKERLSEMEVKNGRLVEDFEELSGNYEIKAEELRVKEYNAEGLRTKIEELQYVKLEQEGQIRNLDKEIEWLKRARLEHEGQIDNLEEEIVGLNKLKIEQEGQIRNLDKEIEGLKRARLEQEGQIGNLEEEVVGLNKLKIEQEGQIRNLEKEIEVLRKVKLEQESQIGDFEREVFGLNAIVLSLREDEAKWRMRFLELEKSHCDVVGELDGLRKDVGLLLGEKKVKELEIEGLIKEKAEILERMADLDSEIECVKRVNEDVNEEKIMLEEVKLRQEDKIRELQSEVSGIRSNLLLLQESNNEELENMTKLLSEIDDHKSELDRVVKERDDVKRALDKEKANGVKLQVKISEISKKMEETGKVIEELKGASDFLVAEKKELENKYGKLTKEKGLVEKNLVESKKKMGDLEGSLTSKSDLLESALSMLRNTARQLSVENKGEFEGMTVKERGIKGELKEYLREVEAIRGVFKTREEKVEEMHREMQELQLSVLEAKRKKTFWTVVSSATTILAAVVSFLYATGVHH